MVSGIALVALAAAQAAQQSPLNLTCFGGGVANKATVVTGSTRTQVYGTVGMTPVNGYANGSTSVVIPREEGFTDQVDIQLFGGDDRIRLPSTTIPLLHGGKTGWYRLKDVVADAHSIRAKAEVNFVNKPVIYIDRVTGTISISGRSGDYSGQCQVVDPNAQAKF